MFFRIISLALLIQFSTTSWAQVHDPKAIVADPTTATKPIAPVLSGLGDYHFKVTTNNEKSQYFFDQGYRLTTGFNHSEALRSFKEAIRLDPDNAMAYWGWALVLGPNLNLPMQESVVAQTYNAIQMAVKLKDNVSPRERDYIDALATRYSNDIHADRAALDATYAAAMKALVDKYPDDVDAATLYAAAVMNTNPWDYWYRDGSPKPHTETVLATLQSVIDRNPRHAGAHHYLIHTVEAFRPELGVKSADILAELMPGAGHLVHMPSHIYMRVGRYEDSFNTNVKAVAADDSYITQCRVQGMYPLTYYPHNLHFMVWAAMFQGRSEIALDVARQVAAKIPVSAENTWALNETFRSQPMFAMVRYGRWTEMLNENKPDSATQFMRGIWHYGRALAYASDNKLAQASVELEHLKNIQKMAAKNQNYATGFASAGGLLAIAKEVAEGEITAKRGDYSEAISHLEKAVRLEDSLLYSEPPDWYFPVRHILGALLLEQGSPAEAEMVYWEDLRRNPENGYSLFGLEKSLRAQNKSTIAASVHERFKKAWRHADVTLKSSRY